MPGSEFPTVIRRRRLWVVSELYYPEETSTGYYLTRIAEGLADAADVRVICGQPNYSRRGIKAAKRERHNGVDIFRVAGTTLNKNVILFRLINMLTLGVTTFFKAIASFGRGDSILVVTTPPSMPFIIASAALLRGAGYTLLIHDNYPEILIAAGKANPRGLFVQILDRLNRWLYKHCERIIVVGRYETSSGSQNTRNSGSDPCDTELGRTRDRRATSEKPESNINRAWIDGKFRGYVRR